MAIPQNKAELTKAIVNNYAKLLAELKTIPSDLTSVRSLNGHTKNTLMNIKDLIAYLVGWGQLVLKWNHRKADGQHVDFPETGFKWNELGLLAQQFYKTYEHDSLETLFEKLDQTVNQILSLIANKTNEELYGVTWYQKWTLGRMIQFNTSSPYQNALSRIRKWRKLNS
ncbi:ClbS/DfsB family four-helix bundle protein [Pedobacter sp. Hv1]|uniref:ClbS/DfsB family four-helix bundle protein n=1 Tax=Pedobacter sp. Hv1 TaxID=1740090 RepID=UPI0006D88E10|nr:ClbS/DfsB family four-helix bundle protein [Pedobacter sp. Hv1]KQC02312.1 hypothetical protein AQF98_01670 [Pedobacter sp. Hv1]